MSLFFTGHSCDNTYCSEGYFGDGGKEDSRREDSRDTNRNCHADIKLCRSTEVLAAQLLKR